MAETIYNTGTKVWFEDKRQGWIPGEVLSSSVQEDGTVEVKFINERQKEITLKSTLRDITNNTSKLPPLSNPSEYEQVEDLTHLPHLNEPSILDVIRNRYAERKLYTYSGIVLVAVNPFTEVPIYGHDVIQTYAGRGRNREELDPHLFTIAEEAYRALQRDTKNQTVIVSGESGAGKTESAKYIMRYMASVKNNAIHEVSDSTSVEHQVLATNPILEAFGNAKTSRNDNSSRFGKYIQILFDDRSSIVGARIRTYLLERSRISFQQRSERNYHIFYQLCEGASPEERTNFGLDSDTSGYRYLSSSSLTIDNVNDAANFSATRQALTIVGIDEEKQLAIFRLLAGILHLGNVEINHRRDAKDAVIDEKNDTSLQKAMELLGIDAAEFAKCTTKRLIDARGEKFSSARTMDQSIGVRDGVAKFIYSCIFDWLVLRINASLSSNDGIQREKSFIAVLDIYGFEHFQTNSFEQFCINYANEKLQQQFISHVFKLEQAEYALEAIDWTTIDFSDNQPCIDLIEGKLGILALLDEESRLATGTDESLIDKLNSQLKTPEHKSIFKEHLHGNEAFTIAHYAGDVSYNIDGFLEKNRGTVPDEHKDLLTSSSNDFLREVIDVGINIGIDTHPGPTAKSKAVGPTKAVSGRKPTQCSVFKSSLLTLTEALGVTDIHYIRCIKPNEVKRPWEFNSPLVLGQLRACGVVETVRITSAGYPTRWTYDEFAARYRVLIPSSERSSSNLDSRQLANAILREVVTDSTKFQTGKTKIFFRSRVLAILEGLRAARENAAAISIQCALRAMIARKRVSVLRAERAEALRLEAEAAARAQAEAEAKAKAEAEAEAAAAAAKAQAELEVAAAAAKAKAEAEAAGFLDVDAPSSDGSTPQTPAKHKAKAKSDGSKDKNEASGLLAAQAQAKATERARARTPTTPKRAATPSTPSSASRYRTGANGSHIELPHFHPDDHRSAHMERCAACRAKAEAAAEATSRQREIRLGRLAVPPMPGTPSKSTARSQSVEPTRGRHESKPSLPLPHGKSGWAAAFSSSDSSKSKRSKSTEPHQLPDATQLPAPTTPRKLRKLKPSAMLRTARSFTHKKDANSKENATAVPSSAVEVAAPIRATATATQPEQELKIYKQFMGVKPKWSS